MNYLLDANTLIETKNRYYQSHDDQRHGGDPRATEPGHLRKFLIPNVCRHFGVPFVDTFELLNALEARFVLGG